MYASIRPAKKNAFFYDFGVVIIDAIAAHKKAPQPLKHPQTARKTDLRNGRLQMARGSCGAKAPCRRAPSRL